MVLVGPCGPSHPGLNHISSFPWRCHQQFSPFRPHTWYLILRLIYHPLGNQQLCIFLQHWLLFPDLFVHQGLREHRFIHLIVPVAPVTNLPGKERCLPVTYRSKSTRELPGPRERGSQTAQEGPKHTSGRVPASGTCATFLTKSTTTSLWKVLRHSAATLHT